MAVARERHGARVHAPLSSYCTADGRPTDALWFNIPLRTRRTIAACLNLAYALHFFTFGMHCIYRSYIAGQTWPGAFWQNLPFVLSISMAVTGGVLQGKAEAALIKVSVPRPATAYCLHLRLHTPLTACPCKCAGTP